MTPLLRSGIVLAALMFAASALAYALRPTQLVAAAGSNISLAQMIPGKLGQWKEEPQFVGRVVNPQLREALDKLYSQTLARTYMDAQGHRVMLSIAYGAQQNDELRVHQPEGCYTGQGFQISEKSRATEIETSSGALPVTRLSATLGQRHEPITYWMRIGNRVARTQWEMKMIQLSYGLQGKVPDGMLVRVSSVSTNEAEAFSLHRDFIDALLTGIDADGRTLLIGSGAR